MAPAADRITKFANGGRPAAGPGRHALLAAPLVAALLGGLTAAPLAATGDLYQVTSEKANLRAGPSDSDNVRTQLGRGEQLLELRREGNWYGVRVLRTGEEGWIFDNLVDRTAQSTLGGDGTAVSTNAGFLDLSESFDMALRSIDSTLGYPAVRSVHQGESNSLRVVANPDWLRATSRDAQLMTALAVYQMWKNHQNNQPVRVTLMDGDQPYIGIADEAGGPRLTSTDAGQRGRTASGP